MDWHFRVQQPNEKVRNPISSEYFDEEIIDRPAQALVREVIQNSLDARAGQGPVRIRFYVSGDHGALDADRAAHWLGHAWPHLTARDSGLRGIPVTPERCPFLVVEDFGTIGLEGDPTEWHRNGSEEKNHFFAFFRAEGVSENTGGRGKWGVGKTVFPRSSRINAHFGLTQRQSDGRRLFMAQAVLRYHSLDTVPYASDGMFGELGPESLVLPIEDPVTHAEFQHDFRVRRNEPGLSVVVPYCDTEITGEAIRQAVAREYFHPILTGKLEVIVESHESTPPVVHLDAGTLLDAISSGGDWLGDDLRSTIDLAVWAHTLPEDQIVRLAPSATDGPPEWSRALFPIGVLEQAVGRFTRGERLALRVPVSVQTSSGETRTSHFDLFLEQDLSGRGSPPVFIRNGIIIPKALERRVRGHHLRALVIIEDRPLATMLGDAETPAHTQWSHKTQNFMDKYRYGQTCLDFVRSAPKQVAEILTNAREQRDRLALADFFPKPPEEEEQFETARPRPKDKRGPSPEPGPKPPRPAPSPLVVDQIDGGFTIRRGDRVALLPARIEVRVAYDRARGNPLSKYHKADFALESLDRTVTGATEVTCAENRMV
ncbi:MAG: hypothetical protein ACRENS_00800, partial [Candidatus Eiseniibacteriota bacterium]